MRAHLVLTFLCYLVTSSFLNTKSSEHVIQFPSYDHGCSEENIIEQNRINKSAADALELIDFPIYLPDDPLPPFDPVPTIQVPFYKDQDFINQFYLNSVNKYVSNTIGTGNCGITAISLLLNFYDSFWHDGFIPSQYDRRARLLDENDTTYFSPGIYNNSSFNCSSNDITEDQEISEIEVFIESEISNRDESFMGLLLYYSEEVEAIDHGSGLNMLNFSYTETINVINKYIQENSVLNGNVNLVSDFADDYWNQSSLGPIRNEVINAVQNGNPVIVGGYKTSPSGIGHLCIAYDYDEVNDILYGHMGWNNPVDSDGQTDFSYNHYNLNNYFGYGITDYCFIFSSINKSIIKNNSCFFLNF